MSDSGLPPQEEQHKAAYYLGVAAGVLGAEAWSNCEYAGRLYDRLPSTMRKRYPHGVLFSYEGFPLFHRYAIKTVQLEDGFRGPTRQDNFRKANDIFGWACAPRGLTWHHCEDGITMLLLDARLHAIGHWGGVRVARQMSIWEDRDRTGARAVTARIQVHGAADGASVSQAERAIGVKFPVRYRQFLLSSGGAMVSTTVPNTSGGYLHEFFDVDDLIEWNTHMRTFGFGSYVPAEYLLVGGGSGGAPCIKTTGEDVGSVWWADFDRAGGIPAEGPTESIMKRLADSLDDLLTDIGGWPA